MASFDSQDGNGLIPTESQYEFSSLALCSGDKP